MKILQIASLILVFVGASFAQNKIAVVDTNIFEDEKLGIRELVIVKKKVAEEFKSIIDELQKEADELKKLSNEIEKMIKQCKIECSTKLLTEKIEKSDKLVKELNTKTDEVKIQIEKRETEIVEPVKKRLLIK